MKVSGIIILLVGTVAMGANAQVLKGTASSSNPRRRFNKMKEADRRRLQSRKDITCLGLVTEGEEGYGEGCRQEDGPVTCNNNGGCNDQNESYQKCNNKGTGSTNTCVCIVPQPGGGSQCTHNYGEQGGRPCCYDGQQCLPDGTGTKKQCVDPPSVSPTNAPTDSPTKNPTDAPTDTPTKNPTDSPVTPSPTDAPTDNPTDSPTKNPTEVPTDAPSESSAPSVSAVPSQMPTDTNSPSISGNPSQAPSVSINPTQIPTASPVTPSPTDTPTKNPSNAPTDTPTKNPSDAPTDTPTKNPSTKSPVTHKPTKSPVTHKPTVDKKELLLLLLLLKLAFLDYLNDLIWKSSMWSGDSWDKSMPGPDTLPSSPSGKAGKMSKAKGSKAGKGGNGGKGTTAIPVHFGGDNADGGALGSTGKDAYDIEKNSASDPAADEGALLIAQLFAMLDSMGVGGGNRRRRSLEAVDISGIKAKFMKRIQTTFNGRRDLEMMLGGAGVGMMGAFQEILDDNKNLFESEDMEAVEAKLESMLNE